MSRIIGWLWQTLLLLSGVAAGITVAGEAQVGRPNILLLMADDMSSRVGAFGDSVAHTPNLDRLAEEGVRFTNVFTTAATCAPSRAAVITGMHQISFGGQHMRTASRPEGSYQTVPPPDVKAFPELLRAAGYFAYTTYKLDYQFSGPMTGSGPFTIWDEEGTDSSWRDRASGQPFFGYQNYLVTHETGVFAPLGSWPHSFTHFAIQLLRAWEGRDYPVVDPISPQDVQVPLYYPDTPTVRRDIARHYTNISVMDAQIGQVLADLEAEGLAEDTIVIWSTDHGDGLPRAKRELYDSGIKVPMIIRWPEKFRPAGVLPGSVDERLISFIDLAPTILALAGVPIPAYMQGRDFNDRTSPPRRYIYAARDRIDEVQDRQRAVRDDRFVYIRSWYPDLPGGHRLAFRENIDMVRELYQLQAEGALDSNQSLWFQAPGKERLYDIQADPYELNDLVRNPNYSDELERMRGAYANWRAETPDWSEESEQQMVERFAPDGEQQVTMVPVLTLQDGELAISCPTDRASIGYRINDGAWQVYKGPIQAISGSTVSAKAVRYGYAESNSQHIEIP